MNSKLLLCSIAMLMALPVGVAHAAAPDSSAPFRLVPEMERPTGIIYQAKADRKAYQKSSQASKGLSQLSAAVHRVWPQIRNIDLVALARYQIEATRGFELPVEPGDLVGQVVGWDHESRLWHLELQGPRLPAKYDIIHRYLTLYATYDPATEKVDDLVVTIRGWILE